MKNCVKGFITLLAAAVLVTGITACNIEASHEHTFAEEWTSDATCHWHAATCGDTDEVSGKAEHDWGSGVVTKKATVTSEGELTYTCICGKTKTETVAKLICTHDWGTGEIKTAATCTKAGVKTYTCSVCGETTTEEIAATGHIWNGTVTTAPTCTAKGTKTYKCTVCGEVLKTEEIAATGHIWNGTVNNSTITFTCGICNSTKTEAKNFYETCTDAETGRVATTSSTYVYFGVFPKSVAYKDNAGKLYAADKTTEITIDENTRVTMGANTYYKGSDGEYYAKVTENGYGSGYTYKDGTTVQKRNANSTRYFKVEPVKWKVLTANYNSTGKALLLAEEILTANVPYNDYNLPSNTRTVDGVSGIYANNYKYSQIRAYLNGLDYYYDTSSTETTKVSTYTSKGFLQTAFTTNAQSLIATTTVVNDGLSTTDAAKHLDRADGYKADGTTSSGYPDYTCADTQDKIFLLSEQEVTTTAYGFSAYDTNGTGNTRIRKTTDYAKANYAYQNSTDGYGGWWWLRSPSYSFSSCARNVYYDGDAISDYFVNYTGYGVVPALSISLQ